MLYKPYCPVGFIPWHEDESAESGDFILPGGVSECPGVFLPEATTSCLFCWHPKHFNYTRIILMPIPIPIPCGTPEQSKFLGNPATIKMDNGSRRDFRFGPNLPLHAEPVIWVEEAKRSTQAGKAGPSIISAGETKGELGLELPGFAPCAKNIPQYFGSTCPQGESAPAPLQSGLACSCTA